MKKLLPFVVTLALIISCSGCSGSSAFTNESSSQPSKSASSSEKASGSSVVLSLGHVQSSGDNVAQDYAVGFQKACAKYGIKVNIYPGGQLGDDTAMIEGLQMGSLDLQITGTAAYTKLCEDLGVLDLAYIWKSYDQMHNVLSGEVGKDLADKLLKASGVRILSYSASFGYRCVGTKGKKVFKTPEEAKKLSLKIRTIESDVYVGTMQAMGFNPTPMSFGEVYTSLQTNVIDGYEHDANTTLANGLNEVINNYILTNHMCGPMGIFMSDKTYEKLTDAQKENISKAADEAAEEHITLAPKKAEESIQKLKSSGVNVVEVDTDSFAKACAAFNQDYCAKHGLTANYEKIMSAQ